MKNTSEIDMFKECIYKMELDELMKKEMIRNIKAKRLSYLKKSKFLSLKKCCFIVATILITIVIGVPVCAKVQSMLKERMKEIPQEKLDELIDQLDAQQVDTDSYNREYSTKEKEMMEKLDIEYHQGRFPEGKITQISDIKEVNLNKVCYLITNGYYYLPERELTEEEILEILDFQYTQGYALGERYQEMYADEIAEKEKKEKEDIENIQTQGGIGVKEAEQIGITWMEKLYPGMESSMEHNTYLYSDDVSIEDSQELIKYHDVYMSYIGSMHEYNYFFIDAVSGNLSTYLHSDSNITKHKAAKQETLNAIQENFEEAKSILSDTFGVMKYDSVFSTYYLNEEDVNDSGSFTYHFMTEDGTDYILKYLVNTGELVEYRDTYYDEYMDMKRKSDEFLKEMKNENYIKRELYRVDLQ